MSHWGSVVPFRAESSLSGLRGSGVVQAICRFTVYIPLLFQSAQLIPTSTSSDALIKCHVLYAQQFFSAFVGRSVCSYNVAFSSETIINQNIIKRGWCCAYFSTREMWRVAREENSFTKVPSNQTITVL